MFNFDARETGVSDLLFLVGGQRISCREPNCTDSFDENILSNRWIFDVFGVRRNENYDRNDEHDEREEKGQTVATLITSGLKFQKIVVLADGLSPQNWSEK